MIENSTFHAVGILGVEGGLDVNRLVDAVLENMSACSHSENTSRGSCNSWSLCRTGKNSHSTDH